VDAMLEAMLAHGGITAAAVAMAVSFLVTIVLMCSGLLDRPGHREDELDEEPDPLLR
jgi:hypothetical protein